MDEQFSLEELKTLDYLIESADGMEPCVNEEMDVWQKVKRLILAQTTLTEKVDP